MRACQTYMVDAQAVGQNAPAIDGHRVANGPSKTSNRGPAAIE
jgi:hypothetical protein